MFDDDPTAPYGRRTRTPVTEFGLTPIPKRHYALRSVIGADAIRLKHYYPREAAPLRLVALHGIKATQRSVINRALRAHSLTVGKPGYHGDTEPLLLITGGQRYLLDGHHRTCLALAAGETTMVMRVQDLDDPQIRHLLTARQAQENRWQQEFSAQIKQIVAEHGGPIFPMCGTPTPGQQAYLDALRASQEKRTTAAALFAERLRAA